MNYFETLERWHQIQAAIKQLQEEEKDLRFGLFTGTFKSPREGVNSLVLPDGRVLKGTYVLNRKLLRDQYLNNWSKLELPSPVAVKLIKTEYEIVVGEYKKLSSELQKKVDTVLEIKPGLPKLELVSPKET